MLVGIGTSATKTAVADSIIATILRRAGVPAELVGTAPQSLDAGIPALEDFPPPIWWCPPAR